MPEAGSLGEPRGIEPRESKPNGTAFMSNTGRVCRSAELMQRARTGFSVLMNVLRRLSQLASHLSVEVRDLQLQAAVLFCVTITHAQTRSEASDAAFVQSAETCCSAFEKLKALRNAWEAFCAHVDLRPEDVDGILPRPVFGKPGLIEIVEDIFGVIEPDEATLREYEVHFRDFWHSRIDLVG